MSISSTSAKEIARIGANMEITSENGLSVTSVKEIIRIVVGNGKHITVAAKSFSATSLKEMAKIGGNNITIAI